MEIPLKDNVEYRLDAAPSEIATGRLNRGQKVFNVAAVLFVAVALVLVGLRLACGGLCAFVDGGSYTAYLDGDVELRYDEKPLVGVRGAYERIDTCGGEAEAADLLHKLAATGVRTEAVGEITIIYAFSPLLPQSVVLKGERVNVMIALSHNKMTIGSPLIKGSY